MPVVVEGLHVGKAGVAAAAASRVWCCGFDILCRIPAGSSMNLNGRLHVRAAAGVKPPHRQYDACISKPTLAHISSFTNPTSATPPLAGPSSPPKRRSFSSPTASPRAACWTW